MDIIESKKNKVKDYKRVQFFVNGSYAFFNEKDINKAFLKNYDIDEKRSTSVYQIDPKDGYEHNINSNLYSIEIRGDDYAQTIKIQDIVTEIIFGKINAINDPVQILSEKDYLKNSKHSDKNSIGYINLITFTSWESSRNQVESLQTYFEHNNEDNSAFFKINSKVIN